MVAPVVNAEYLNEIEAARRDLRALISSEQCAPKMLRLAWHDACTYDAKTNTGGPNGSIRRKEELQHSYNKSLEGAVNLCEPIKMRHPKITYADLYQLAGVVAIEVTGGPTIDFVPGRQDANKSPKEGRVPTDKQDAEGLRQAFFRMGLSDKDIVAFCGGNTLLGGTEPLKFDNSYFLELIKGESEGSLKVPTHKALVEDAVFWGYVQLYAKDEEAFLRDYAHTHKKLSELGLSVPFSCRVALTKSLLGLCVALTCCAVLFSNFYELHRRVG